MSRLLFFLLFTLLCQYSFAQEKNIQGYVVMLKGDTVTVDIKDEVEEKYRDRVLVFANNTYKEYGKEEITAFGVKDQFHYRKVNYVNPLEEMKTEAHFAKVLFDGSQKLLGFQRGDRPYFIYQDKDTTCFLYDDQRLNSGEVTVSGNFRNQLFFFGRNCEKATQKLERVNLTEGSLVAYMTSLATCNGNLPASTVYYKKPTSKKEWIVFAGGMAFNNQSELMFQVNQRRIFASKSKKTSLNYGILVTHSAFDISYSIVPGLIRTYRQNSLLVQVPAFVQYNVTTGAIQPYFYAGGSVVYIQQNEVTNYLTGSVEKRGSVGGTLLIGAGIEARIAPRFWVKADYHYDLFFHLPVLGLMYKF